MPSTQCLMLRFLSLPTSSFHIWNFLLRNFQRWEEWGNPSDKEFYYYMKSYSPYDNVAATNYPNMLIRSAINDTRVPVLFSASLSSTELSVEVLGTHQNNCKAQNDEDRQQHSHTQNYWGRYNFL